MERRERRGSEQCEGGAKEGKRQGAACPDQMASGSCGPAGSVKARAAWLNINRLRASSHPTKTRKRA